MKGKWYKLPFTDKVGCEQSFKNKALNILTMTIIFICLPSWIIAWIIQGCNKEMTQQNRQSNLRRK